MEYPRKKFLGLSTGLVFSFAFLFVLEYVLFTFKGISFFSILKSGNITPLVVFICGCIIGMAWEYIGQFGLKWWYYPSINEHWSLMAALPIFWGIFMVIMQDMYAMFRIAGLGAILAVIVSSFIVGLLVEGVNLYTRSWVYTGWMTSPIVLVLSWIVLLSYTFVIGFNGFIINIFGF